MKKGNVLTRVLAVLLVLVAAGSITAVATNGSVMAELFYRDIGLVINGEEVIPKDANGNVVEPFIIDGTTYLPVRAVGEALGLDVAWDGPSTTVTLTEPGRVPPESGYGRLNPAPIGEAQTLTVEGYSYDYTATVCVTEILSGDEMASIMGSPVANDDPDEGCEFVAIKVKITLNDVTTEASISFGDSLFEAYTSNNESLSRKFVYLEDGNYLSSTLYEGGSAEGYIVMQRKIGDAGAKMAFELNYDGTGGLWFLIA